MSKQVKIWLIVATVLVTIGLVMFVILMEVCNWDFTKISTIEYVTNTYELEEEFDNISINIDTTDIVFLKSNDNKSRVVNYEQKNIKYYVNVKNNTLIIDEVDERKWYEYIGISFNNPKISIYLSEDEYDMLSIEESTGDIVIPKDFMFENIDILTSTGDVENYASTKETIKIKTSTGDICVKDVSSGKLDLSVSTGDITILSITCENDVKISVTTGDVKLTDILCKNVISSGDTGNIFLKNIIAEEKFSIIRSTGDVKFDSCDASDIFVKTDTGDVNGSLITDKVFITQTSTGSVDVPKTITGGKCEIITSTGDIKLDIHKD